MGEVFRARDTRLDRVVAIKVLPPASLADPVARLRFEREARAVAALDHPHICAIHDIGEDAGRPYLVLEYLEGQTLAQRLARGSTRTPSRASGSSASNAVGDTRAGQAVPVDELLRIATELAEAIAAAHRAGIVHRDLKPGNIILTKAGVKVLDFGLAKLQSAADVQHSAREAATMTGEQPLTAQGTTPNSTIERVHYWPTPDGQRFLFIARQEAAMPRTINMVFDWPALVNAPSGRK
jgi:serine/threonine protein kinase